MLSTVQKIRPVLDLFTAERPEWRGLDIARALDMPKSSAYTLLATLVEIGLLSTSESGKYQLGWNLLSWSNRMCAGLAFRQFALGPMRELSRRTRETVLLAALDQHEVVYLDRVEGQHPMVRLAGVRPGDRLPAHATAVGKVLLAFREPLEVQMRMARATWTPLTPRTANSLTSLQTQLSAVRTHGVAIDRGEVVPDVACVAGPVRDPGGAVVAAISVSLPAYRFDERRDMLIKRVAATCTAVSRAIAGAVGNEDDDADVREGATIVTSA